MSANCPHTTQSTSGNANHCVLCGTIYLAGSVAIKDPAYNTRADVPPPLLYSNMLNDQLITRCHNPSAPYLSVPPSEVLPPA